MLGACLISFQVESSYPTTSNYKSFVEQHYAGSVKEFETQINSTIRYPAMSRHRCEIGEAIVEIKIADSKVKQITFNNRLPKLLEEQITQTIMSTNGQWKPSASGEVLEMSFGFQLGFEILIGGDFKVQAIPLSGSTSCEATEEIEASVKKWMAKKKYQKALANCEKLLSRYPRNKEYLLWYDKLQAELN